MCTIDKNRTIALLLAVLLSTQFISCNDNTDTIPAETMAHIQKTTATVDTSVAEESIETLSETETEETIPVADISEESFEEISDTVVPSEETDELGLTQEQKNCFSMLYHLAITAEEIRVAQDNKLILDNIYTSLLNELNPGAIDKDTQDYLNYMREDIKDLRNIVVKREQMQYLYNQEKADLIREAVPNPLSILSMTNSFDWKTLAINAVYTVVSSYTQYKNASDTAEQQFLTSGWELDADGIATIQRNRERAFNYMVDIVRDYKLDGKMTLNEKAVEEFAKIKKIENDTERVKRLEAEESTYRLLGNYWLELADGYFKVAKYEKCLEAVFKYKELASDIYRQDYNYVQILPKAIVAAQEIFTDSEYIEVIGSFADEIIENTDPSEWSVRYFAIQIYLDLYARTGSYYYLETAYTRAYENVLVLLEEQRALNTAYLEPVKELTESTIEDPNYRSMKNSDEKKAAEEEYKAELKRLKAYNKSLHEARKTDLPPLYDPLLLNCDLLFALAEQMEISTSEQEDIESILQDKVFLSKAVADRYLFTAPSDLYSIEFNIDKIVIPATLLSDGVEVSVSIHYDNRVRIINDLTLNRVERKGDSIDTFQAYYSSKNIKNFEWTPDSKVVVSIQNGEEYEPLVFKFRVSEHKDNWLFKDKVVFEAE